MNNSPPWSPGRDGLIPFKNEIMKVHLMNSAIMPRPGRYTSQQIPAAEFFAAVQAAYRAGQLVSWIGYRQNARLITRMTGIPVTVTRAEIDGLAPGDVLLCMRLRYRTDHAKGAPVDEGSFEYFKVQYENS